MTSLENVPVHRLSSLVLGLPVALCSPCLSRSFLLLREGAGSRSPKPILVSLSRHVSANFERGRPLRRRPRVLARVVPRRAAPPASTRAPAAAQRPLFVEHARHSAARWHRRAVELLNPTFLAGSFECGARCGDLLFTAALQRCTPRARHVARGVQCCREAGEGVGQPCSWWQL